MGSLPRRKLVALGFTLAILAYLIYSVGEGSLNPGAVRLEWLKDKGTLLLVIAGVIALPALYVFLRLGGLSAFRRGAAPPFRPHLRTPALKPKTWSPPSGPPPELAARWVLVSRVGAIGVCLAGVIAAPTPLLQLGAGLLGLWILWDLVRILSTNITMDSITQLTVRGIVTVKWVEVETVAWVTTERLSLRTPHGRLAINRLWFKQAAESWDWFQAQVGHTRLVQ